MVVAGVAAVVALQPRVVGEAAHRVAEEILLRQVFGVGGSPPAVDVLTVPVVEGPLCWGLAAPYNRRLSPAYTPTHRVFNLLKKNIEEKTTVCQLVNHVWPELQGTRYLLYLLFHIAITYCSAAVINCLIKEDSKSCKFS